MIGPHHYGSAANVFQHNIHTVLYNIEQIFLAIFIIVSCCLILQLSAFYYVYVTYHQVQLRLTAISPPSYEVANNNSNVQPPKTPFTT